MAAFTAKAKIIDKSIKRPFSQTREEPCVDKPKRGGVANLKRSTNYLVANRKTAQVIFFSEY